MQVLRLSKHVGATPFAANALLDTEALRHPVSSWGAAAVGTSTGSRRSRSRTFGRGDDTVGNPHRAHISQFDLFELKSPNASFFELDLDHVAVGWSSVEWRYRRLHGVTLDYRQVGQWGSGDSYPNRRARHFFCRCQNLEPWTIRVITWPLTCHGDYGPSLVSTINYWDYRPPWSCMNFQAVTSHIVPLNFCKYMCIYIYIYILRVCMYLSLSLSLYIYIYICTHT